jgi:hypothetical protein
MVFNSSYELRVPDDPRVMSGTNERMGAKNLATRTVRISKTN